MRKIWKDAARAMGLPAIENCPGGEVSPTTLG